VYRLAGAAFVLTLLLCACIEARPEVSFTPEPMPTEIQGARWAETPVSYCIVRDEVGGFVPYETFVSLTHRAMEAWGVPVTFEGDCPGPITRNNGINELGWGDLPGDPAELTEAGQTKLLYQSSRDGSPPDIVEADITIEREPAQGKATEECLYTTLLHETGHLLGLPHLETSNVMAPVIVECLQELTEADRAALDALYG